MELHADVRHLEIGKECTEQEYHDVVNYVIKHFPNSYIAISEELKGKMMDSIYNGMAEEIKKQVETEDYVIKHMLRYQVQPPIKGEITQNKIRWRGIKIAMGTDGTFLGLMQRTRLIKPDWVSIKMVMDASKLLLFGRKMKEVEDRQEKYTSGGILNNISKQ